MSQHTRQYKVAGLDCAEEITALRNTVGKLDGVKELAFNLMQATMTVTAIAALVDDAKVIAAGKRAGLAVTVYYAGNESQETSGNHWQVWLCVGSLILLIAGFAIHAIGCGSVVQAFTGGGDSHAYPRIAVIAYALSALAGTWLVWPKTWQSIRHLQPDMNLLMTLAVAGAALIGEWLESASVAFLFALSLMLESWSVARARRAIKGLLSVTPPTARVVCPHEGDIHESAVDAVAVGAIVEVRPGDRVPLDGVVTEGSTTVNQAPITGESLPAVKECGSEVYAGSINESGLFRFRVTHAAADTTISRIIRMVEEANERRAPVEQWVEKFARVYTPTMLVLAVGIAVVPPLLFSGAWSAWFYQALVVLVIACPCALVIATPVAIIAALASAAHTGVLIKGGAYLQIVADLKAIALDKTGTITYGRPTVQVVEPLNGHDEIELLERVAALEAGSTHPLALALLQYAHTKGVVPAVADEHRLIPGKGAEGLIEGRLFWIGSHRLLHERGAETAAMHNRMLELEARGNSVVVVGNDNHVCGFIGVADAIRAEAAGAITRMRKLGVRTIAMLTGDNESSAREIGTQIGIDDIRAELLPEEKMVAVEQLARDYGNVAMVGDGINDAPALASATLGIAMGAAGSDAAIETADIALMSDDLNKLPWLIAHARATRNIIRQNIMFALGLKAVFLILALCNIASLWLAIMADTGATLIVVLNALRLLKDDLSQGRETP